VENIMSTLIEHELSHLAPTKNTSVSIGMFDGLHMGHQTLVRQLVKQVHANNSLSVVITFKQHPSTLLAPHKAVPLLINLDERIRLLKAAAVDIIIPLTFSQELAVYGAQSFVSLLQQSLNMQSLIIGWDFALVHHREGSLETLLELGHQLGFKTEVVEPVKYHDSIVSSTAIRHALSSGDISTANAMLTRPFQLEGIVVKGDARGTKLGFPTANFLLSSQQALPADGVYATIATLGEQNYYSATFIGTRPTFNGIERIAEPHLLDFNGNLYNRNLKIDIIERVRGVVHFPDAQALKTQIALDILQVRQILTSYNNCKNH